ncbi:anti-sigma factor domain-containing protein [Xanthobacter autotrophicus]|uniref:anti-sigma factor n=1 Tax=Xanthobacter autotrophicus TaxID=280 RepID=UPI00372A629B
MSEDFHARAGEYVLGLLDREEAEACAARLVADPAFAMAVEHWRARLAEFDLSAPAQMPSAAVWDKIAAATAAPPAAISPARARQPLPGWRAALSAMWESLPVWRGIGLGAAAATLLLALGLGFQMREAARTPVLVAVLLSGDNRPAAVVNTFRDGRAELIPLAALRAPEGKSLQVWTLWDRTRGPVSVGLVDALRSLDLQLKGLPTAVPEQLFEVTLEPAGGSPTGRPTGPILMKGTASRAL